MRVALPSHSRANDAEWIADLLQYGLLTVRFIPSVAQRDRRDLTRRRSNFVRERSNLVNRLQKTLEGGNIKLASVASTVVGVSGRAILSVLIAGQTDPVILAELSRGQLCTKREQLASRDRVGQTPSSLCPVRIVVPN